MKTIWKFPIPVQDIIYRVMMPEGAEVLHFDVQNDQPTIWARVDPARSLVPHTFRLAGTGHLLNNAGRHLGTCFHGPLVWHLFEFAP